VLVQPNYDLPFIVVTDASTSGLGGYVGQVDTVWWETHGAQGVVPGPENGLRIISYCSRVLQGAEKNYSATELEALAVVYALSKFRVYVLGQSVKVFTDHSALVHIARNENVASLRLMRFLARIAIYNPTFQYVRGSSNVLADALSRCGASSQGGGTIEMDIEHSKAEEKCLLIMDNMEYDMRTLQDQDQEVQEAKLAITKGSDTDLVLLEDIVYHRTWQKGKPLFQIYVPKRIRLNILQAHHDDLLSGHVGVAKTFGKLRLKYYWKGYHRDVYKYVRSCALCQRTDKKRDKVTIPTMPLFIVEPFERMGIDVLGPLPTTSRGKKYLVVLVDHGTKWPEAFATENVTSTTIADLIYSQVICRYGPPKELLSDRGTNFLSKITRKLLEVFEVKKLSTTSYHPACNGQVERMNGILTKILRKTIEGHQESWDAFVPAALFAYRTTPHAIMEVSPYQMMFGRNPRLPIDITLNVVTREACDQGMSYEDFVSHITETRMYGQQLMEEHQSVLASGLATTDPCFQINDKVWLYTPIVKEHQTKKLTIMWTGPYTILEVRSQVNYLIQHDESRKTQHVHVSRIKKVIDDITPEDLPEDIRLPEELEEDIADVPSDLSIIRKATEEQAPMNEEVECPVRIEDGEELFEVEEILDVRWIKRGKRRMREYLVKWYDQSDRFNSWEPPRSFKDPDTIRRFHANRG